MLFYNGVIFYDSVINIFIKSLGFLRSVLTNQVIYKTRAELMNIIRGGNRVIKVSGQKKINTLVQRDD